MKIQFETLIMIGFILIFMVYGYYMAVTDTNVPYWLRWGILGFSLSAITAMIINDYKNFDK